MSQLRPIDFILNPSDIPVPPRARLLAVALGYTYAAHDHTKVVCPRTEFVLPQDPFTIIGPFVIIRELILDEFGESRRNRRGREKHRRKVRLLPSI